MCVCVCVCACACVRVAAATFRDFWGKRLLRAFTPANKLRSTSQHPQDVNNLVFYAQSTITVIYQGDTFMMIITLKQFKWSFL